MISFLDGELVEVLPTQAIISVQGVGYLVQIPLSSFDRLPQPGARVRLLTHFVVREDAHLLFGFVTAPERDLFRLLLQHVSGIGPKLALAVLSGMSVNQFKTAVVNRDIDGLARLKGVGKKTAERMILELKDKFQDFAETAAKPAVQTDVVSALENLGYPRGIAEGALNRAANGDGDAAFDTLFKRALQILTKG